MGISTKKNVTIYKYKDHPIEDIFYWRSSKSLVHSVASTSQLIDPSPYRSHMNLETTAIILSK